MGFEYRLTFRSPTRSLLDDLLRSCRGFERFDADRQIYILDSRSEREPGGMPQLELKIEPFGLYACDYGSGRELLLAVQRELEGRFGTVSLADLE